MTILKWFLRERFLKCSCAMIYAVAGIGSACKSETLIDAIDSAFAYNPALAALRAKQRVTDEQLPIIRANGMPSLFSTSSVAENYEPVSSIYSTPVRSANEVLTFGLPLYSGGTVKHAMHSAQWGIEAGKAGLRSADSTLLVNVVTAYVEVLAARNTVKIDAQYVAELEQSLVATRRRFSAGELTKTDIAQTETSLASARVTYLAAAASLRSAEEQFTYYVGHKPVDLVAPPVPSDLPDGEADALAVALKLNPDLDASRKAVLAARENTSSVLGSRLPQIKLFATGNYVNYVNTAQNPYLGRAIQQVYTTGQVGIQMTLPLYQGGKPGAQIRSARDQEWAAQASAEDTKANVTAQTRSTFAQWQALGQELDSAKDQARAAEDAYIGVKKLNVLGSRTIQDVLYADQAVLTAKSQLIQVDASRYIAAVTLLAKMGVLSPEMLGAKRPDYDPEINEQHARHSILDWGPVETSQISSGKSVERAQR